MLKTRDLFLSFAVVLLLAVPPALADLVIGKTDKQEYSIPACDTEAQMMDVMSQKTTQGVRERLAHYNGVMVNGEPVCGRIEGSLTVIRVVATVKVEDFTVTVIEFAFDEGKRRAFGITTLPVRGESV